MKNRLPRPVAADGGLARALAYPGRRREAEEPPPAYRGEIRADPCAPERTGCRQLPTVRQILSRADLSSSAGATERLKPAQTPAVGGLGPAEMAANAISIGSETTCFASNQDCFDPKRTCFVIKQT